MPLIGSGYYIISARKLTSSFRRQFLRSAGGRGGRSGDDGKKEPGTEKKSGFFSVYLDSVYLADLECHSLRGVYVRNRVIYGALMIVLMLTCVFVSPFTRLLFFAAAGCLCAVEYSRQMEKLEMHCCLSVMILYLAVQAVLVYLDTGIGSYSACFVGAVYLAMISGIFRKEVKGNGALDTAAGLAYPCLLFGVVMYISVSGIWAESLAIGCLAAWLCDTGALLGGKRFGKHRMAPAISPNKTVEGAVIGELSAAAAGILVYYLGIWCREIPWIAGQYVPLPLWLCITVSLAAAAMGQLGDLAESLIKRMIGVKDFSNLIPGHGGVFDRADSLLFSIPTAYFLLRLAGI